jgi:beta-glucanase (GH16 family)
MKPATVILVMALAAPAVRAEQPADDLPSPPEGKAWKLVWSDEFDGTRLDESKWEVPEGRRRDGWWSREAISLDGEGNLVISTLKKGDKYLDGCVRTRGKFERAFGYYVARVKLQEQPGHWTAFWLYNSSVGRIGDEGRDGTEIDIMEKPWRDGRVQHALHWDGYGKHHESKGQVAHVPGVMDGWHTFSIWWKPDEYIFYVDGKETWRTSAGGVCQVPLYIKLSDEIGDWAVDIGEASLPDRFLVDYVRVYDVAEPGLGVQESSK